METRHKRRMETKTVDLTVIVPVVHTPPTVLRAKQRIDKLPRNVKLATLFVSMTVVASALTYNLLSNNHRSAATANQAELVQKQLKLAYYELDYDTLLPAGKTIQDLGGWRRVSPPDRNPTFAFADKIGTTGISVSQQPLPDTMKPDVDRDVKDLARQFGAIYEMKASGTTLHIGTSTNGPQSVIFHKKGLLILIKSTAKVSDDAWIEYIKSLN